MPEPWDRRRGDGKLEPNLWYDRFTDFRLMGADRVLLEIVNRWRDKRGKERRSSIPGAWSRNAARWAWRERAEAWDAEQRRKRIEAEEQARAEMLRRHAKQAQGLQSVGSLRISLYARERLEKLGPADRLAEIEKITLSEARRYILDGTTLERQALGLPEHLLEVALMTDDELREQYAELLRAFAEPGGDAGGDDEAGTEAAPSPAAEEPD